MEVTLTLILICCLAFFIAGCIDSIAGGGGLITTPTLLMLGVPAHFCLGSTKLASMCGSSVALFTFWQNKQIIEKVALIGAISSFVGGVLGSWLALSIDNQKMTLIMVGLIPVGLAISLLSGVFKIDKEVEEVEGWRWKAILIGITVGMYEGFFGPGAGSFFLIGIHVLLKAGLVKSSGTAKIFNIFANLGAVCTFASAGTVAYSLAI
ncbi:sulfite exporter TauE/SafE family protein, partial [Turicimonas muris]